MDTATPTPTTNGDGAAALDPLARHAQELEELLAPLAARRSQLEAELTDVGEHEQRIIGAITALTGKGVKAQTQPPKKSTSKYRTSQKTQDDVYACIATSEGDMTANEISEKLGLSHSAAMQACRELREAERIRIVGARRTETDERTGGRAPSAYAVMPNG